MIRTASSLVGIAMIVVITVSCGSEGSRGVSSRAPGSPAARSQSSAHEATPYANTPYYFLDLAWGSFDSTVRRVLKKSDYQFEGGITPEGRDISVPSCLSALRPDSVPNYAFRADRHKLQECLDTRVTFAVFGGRIFTSLDKVLVWFDEEYRLVRLKVALHTSSPQDAASKYARIFTALQGQYGSPVRDSLASDRGIIRSSGWWDQAGHSLTLSVENSNYGAFFGAPEYRVTVDYAGPQWERYQRRRADTAASVFR